MKVLKISQNRRQVIVLVVLILMMLESLQFDIVWGSYGILKFLTNNWKVNSKVDWATD